jgi:hypothetical protein
MKLLAWLQNFHPEMHAAVIERVGEAPPPGGLSQLSAAWDMLYPSNYYRTGYRGRWHSHNGAPEGLGQNGGEAYGIVPTVGETTWWQDAISGIKEAGVAYLQYDAQKDIIALQTARIEQGKEPIDTALIAPTIRHQIDIPADIRKEIGLMGQGAMTWIMLGGVGLVAWMMLRR